MKDCYFTKSKGIANDNNIPYLGGLIGIVKKTTDTIRVGYSTTGNKVKNLSGDFINPSGVDEFVANKASYGTGASHFSANVNDKVLLNNKYDIAYLVTPSTKLFNIQAKDLNYMGNLITLSQVYIIGSVDEIETVNTNLATLEIKSCEEISGTKKHLAQVFPNIQQLKFIGSPGVEGSIEDLGSLTQIKSVELTYSYVRGTIEGFVAAQKIAGVDTNSTGVSLVLGAYAQTNFKDHRNNNVTSTVIWAPNASDNTNTDITFNNETTTIHVNNDGTWTRVS